MNDKEQQAQQWLSVSVTYQETDKYGNRRKVAAELLMDDRMFGTAEKTARFLLQNKERVKVTACARKLVNGLLEAANVDKAESEDWATYEAKTAEETSEGKVLRRTYLVQAPTFQAAADAVDWGKNSPAERITLMAERPEAIIVSDQAFHSRKE